MVNPPNSNRPPNLSKGRTVSNVNIPPPDTQWSGYLLSMDLDGSQASEVAGAAPTPNPYDAETAPAEESLSHQPAQHLTHEEIAARVERSIQERMKEKCPPISQKHLSFSAVAWKKKMTFCRRRKVLVSIQFICNLQFIININVSNVIILLYR